MKKNFKEISKNLNTKGFFIIKNFISSSDIDSKFLNHVKKKEKFVLIKWMDHIQPYLVNQHIYNKVHCYSTKLHFH